MEWWNDLRSHVGRGQLLGRRSAQQDFADVVPFACAGNGALVVVTDGHSVDGARAATVAAGRIARDVVAANSRDEPVFRDAFLAAHRDLLQAGVDGGTTATCVSVHADKLVTAWVGNGEARVVTADGGLVTLAIPHEYGVHRGETARLDASGAAIEHPDAWVTSHGMPTGERPKRGRVSIGNASLEMTRVLGDPEFDPHVLHEPELHEHVRRHEDRWLIVATDGVWHAAKRTSKRNRIGQVIAQSLTAGEAATKLAALLGTWRIDDNATFVIVDLDGIG